MIEETSNIRIDNPVHLPLRDADVQGVQGLVLASSRTKAIAEPEKILFVDAFQNRARRLLDNLVLQSGDTQRAELALPFWDVSPLRGLGSVGTPMDSSVQIVDPPFKLHLVIMPRLAIDSWRGLLLQVEETRPQQLRREVVQQTGELQLPILLCRLSYTQQPTRPGSERRTVRVPALYPDQ